MHNKTMKAAWYEKTGAPEVLQYGDAPSPAPAAGEVLVRVRASGVNPSDVKTRAGARGAMRFPRQIPHSDGAGVVEAVGDGVSPARIGERVWLWNAAFGRAHGACAEYVALPEAQAVAMHNKTGFWEGACFGVPLMTAAFGILGDGAADGGTVLISGGAGAVGFYAAQVAKLSGAKVIATVSGEAKAAHAARANPDYILNYKTDDVAECVLEITGGAGVDRILEVEFGGNLQISTQVLKAGGTIAAYGSMAEPNPRLPFYPLMFNNISVKMFLIYAINEKARAAVLRAIGELEPRLTHAVAEVLPLSQTRRAHELAESGGVVGNIVIRTDGE